MKDYSDDCAGGSKWDKFCDQIEDTWLNNLMSMSDAVDCWLDDPMFDFADLLTQSANGKDVKILAQTILSKMSSNYAEKKII